MVHFSDDDDESMYPEYTTLASTPRVLQEYVGIEAFLVLDQEPKTIYASKERANIIVRPKTICLPGGDFSRWAVDKAKRMSGGGFENSQELDTKDTYDPLIVYVFRFRMSYYITCTILKR